MPRVPRVGELLAFDLALSIRQPGARPWGAPSLFPSEARGESQGRCTLAGFDEAGRGALAGPVVVGCVAIPAELLGDASRIEALLGGVDDSKKLTPKAREAAFAGVVSCARWAVGCASASEIDCVGIVAAAERAACRAYRRLGVVADLAVFDRGLSLGEPVPLDPESRTREESSLGSLGSLSFLGGRSAGLSVPNDPNDPNELNKLNEPNDPNDPNEPNELNEPNKPNELPPVFPPGVAFTRGDMRSLHVAAASIVAKVTRDHLMERLDAAFPGFEWSRHKGYGTEEHRRAILRLGPSPIHRRTFLHFTEGAQSQSC
jgi:ribonuclease HII